MPDALLAISRVAFVPVLVAVTVAPGMTAPDPSFTSPVIVPSVCAPTGTAINNRATKNNDGKIRRMTDAPSLIGTDRPHRRGFELSIVEGISVRRATIYRQENFMESKLPKKWKTTQIVGSF